MGQWVGIAIDLLNLPGSEDECATHEATRHERFREKEGCLMQTFITLLFRRRVHMHTWITLAAISSGIRGGTWKPSV